MKKKTRVIAIVSLSLFAFMGIFLNSQKNTITNKDIALCIMHEKESYILNKKSINDSSECQANKGNVIEISLVSAKNIEPTVENKRICFRPGQVSNVITCELGCTNSVESCKRSGGSINIINVKGLTADSNEVKLKSRNLKWLTTNIDSIMCGDSGDRYWGNDASGVPLCIKNRCDNCDEQWLTVSIAELSRKLFE